MRRYWYRVTRQILVIESLYMLGNIFVMKNYEHFYTL